MPVSASNIACTSRCDAVGRRGDDGGCVARRARQIVEKTFWGRGGRCGGAVSIFVETPGVGYGATREAHDDGKGDTQGWRVSTHLEVLHHGAGVDVDGDDVVVLGGDGQLHGEMVLRSE
jgi:hypothetical protein